MAAPEPTYQTVGQRKELRRRIRNLLGTSSEGAPSIRVLFSVAGALDNLMGKTSNGRYGVTITKRVGNGVVESLDSTAKRLREINSWDPVLRRTRVMIRGLATDVEVTEEGGVIVAYRSVVGGNRYTSPTSAFARAEEEARDAA